MMESELVKAQRYHDHAQELQSLADLEAREELRRELLDLASQYDDLCRKIVTRHLSLRH